MIKLEHVTKQYHIQSGWRTVLDDINFEMNGTDKIGFLGRNGAGKSTLIRLISGIEQPTSGKVTRETSVSWPLAFGGAFQGTLTGMDNLRFIARIYDVDIQHVRDYVQDFAELGNYLYEPVKSYSAGMRARFAFALSMAIEFDCFLIDEVIAVGDAKFQRKCEEELFEKRKDRGIILVSHEVHNIRERCESVCVLNDGKLKFFQNVDEGFEHYNALL
ncbi:MULTISPECIES: ABC transporter ATP-binding protein [Acinetobacter]|jgi:capsular polysaccharide transport system ATP-binding protein|uniref:ATP-binding cassette domain-containing protein n=1 Tax=Acinetobacter chengduensis TaxID=2420890 RepID=A0ABX9TXY4_9GAMM|nr:MULTISPECIES: ABC transporter ATP-binding protein [Acinetobacter]MBI1450689.1 ABC transporter ATP-binding protein [Acinetobacter sp. FL51]RKG40773.1 ABC transporter ATP-binding protein [Acinetobacter sp. WCHAc060007]RLL22847.1 ATP-binding cassette domain-containing protein [Acinetobacter chengduensis]